MSAWAKLFAGYWNDVVIAVNDDATEVMFTRAIAYCSSSKTRGFIVAQALPSLTRKPAMAKQIAKKLCAPVGEFNAPWEVVKGGYQIRNWSVYQDQLDQLEARRKNDRERKRMSRDRHVTVTEKSQPMSHDVTGGEIEEEKEAAAAAPAGSGSIDLTAHPKIEILRSRLAAFTALSALRYDTLTAEQVEQVENLIDLHGDQRLVQTAKSTCRTPPPLYVTAFIGTWASLPTPGKTLEAVKEPTCSICSMGQSRCSAANQRVEADARHEFSA